MPIKRTYRLTDYVAGGRTQRAAPANAQRRGAVSTTPAAPRGRAGGTMAAANYKLGTKTGGTSTGRRRP